MQLFRDVLSYNDLYDLGFIGSPYTWQSAGVKSRLDRGVASSSWSDICTHARVVHLPPIHGDHTPILLGVFQAPVTRRRRCFRFRFESYWLQNDTCSDAVQLGWNDPGQGRSMGQVIQKIRATRLSLLHWQRNTFGHRGKEIEQLRSRLQDILVLPPSLENQQEHQFLSGRLDSLLATEHAYWSQRAKISWLTDGDPNTKFFHRKASNRRAKNKLVGLFDVNGVWQSCEVGMEGVVLDYFRSMYTAAPLDPIHMHSVVSLIQPKVTPVMNQELCAEYSSAEIKSALFQMYPTKAPGPDGMSPLFFQHYWESIGPDVVAAVQGFFSTGHLLH